MASQKTSRRARDTLTAPRPNTQTTFVKSSPDVGPGAVVVRLRDKPLARSSIPDCLADHRLVRRHRAPLRRRAPRARTAPARSSSGASGANAAASSLARSARSPARRPSRRCAHGRARRASAALVRLGDEEARWRGGVDGGASAFPSKSTVARPFGSWEAAQRAAGFAPRRRCRTNEALIEALRRDAQRRGRAPYCAEGQGATSDERPDTSTAVDRFGSWRAALAAAGLIAAPAAQA